LRASLQDGSLAASPNSGLSRLLSLSDSLTIPQLQSALTSAAMDMGTMIEGPGSRFHKTRQQEIQELVESSSTPTEARAWLRDLVEILDSEVKTHLIWEYDLEVNDVKRYI
jgi:hypothetical protein